MRCLISILILIGTVSLGQPNIIVFLADDQGAETARPYGGSWDTPNIDNIATNGMRFTNCHACESCAPSRATLLTGKYSDISTRMNPIVSYPLMMAGPMSTNETTIADILGDAGYATCVVGKWNLYFGTADDTVANRDTQMTHIQDCGFDTNYTFIGHTITYWGDTDDFWGSDAGYVDTNYFPYLVNQFATNWITTQVNAGTPFYLKYSFGLPHQPYEVTPDNLSQTNETDAVKVIGMYTYMDKMLSNVVACVTDLGVISNTVIMYAGDNGTDPALTNSYNGTDIAGGKLTTDDTATWVPMYWQWLGTIATNSTYTGLTSFADVMPTIAEIAGATVTRTSLFDGISFYNGLLGNTTNHRNSMWRSGWRHSHDMFKYGNYKYAYLNDVLYDTSNTPYGDVEIASPNIYEKVQKVMLSAMLNNETNKAYGDTAWGGHTNELFFAQ